MSQHSADKRVQDQGCRAIANLAAGSDDSQTLVARLGGIALLLTAMEEHKMHEQAILAMCNVGWQQRFCQDAIKELGGLERIEKVLASEDVTEAATRWGQVLVEKLQSAGVQRGILLDHDVDGRPTGYTKATSLEAGTPETNSDDSQASNKTPKITSSPSRQPQQARYQQASLQASPSASIPPVPPLRATAAGGGRDVGAMSPMSAHPAGPQYYASAPGRAPPPMEGLPGTPLGTPLGTASVPGTPSVPALPSNLYVPPLEEQAPSPIISPLTNVRLPSINPQISPSMSPLGDRLPYKTFQSPQKGAGTKIWASLAACQEPSVGGFGVLGLQDDDEEDIIARSVRL
eukprot:Tamp_10859.p1 GENE.Tamp_10859~~Tamp_10859.p1  ORF type:complete len:346 (+),score=37.40 Tamp_10859:903-1940(+)